LAKSAEAFRTISEAADELGVAQHVLRFWETRFTFVKPMKRAGGRRFYRPSDIAVLAAVRRLLHQEGYTIKGVQKLYRESGLKRLTGEAEPAFDTPGRPTMGDDSRTRLEAALAELDAARARLDKLLGR
jgi:DNA-binding transcriptional MerR regulator